MKTVCNHTLATALPKMQVFNTKYLVPRRGRNQVLSNKILVRRQEYNTVFSTKTLVFRPQNKISLHLLFVLLLSVSIFSCKSIREIDCIMPPPTTTIPPKPLQQVTATINGTVMDREGKPLNNVQVLLLGKLLATTDESGRYIFTETFTEYSRNTINFTKLNYNTASVSYNTAMGNTNYTVQMGKPCQCDSIIIDNFCSCIQPIELTWTDDLIDEEKVTFDTMIECLKRTPNCNIQLTYVLADANKRIASPRVERIKRYFVKKGIREERISTIVISNKNSEENKLLIQKQ